MDLQWIYITDPEFEPDVCLLYPIDFIIKIMLLKLNLHMLVIKCFCYENKESNAGFIVFIHGPWFLKKTDISSITFLIMWGFFPLENVPSWFQHKSITQLDKNNVHDNVWGQELIFPT